MDARKLKGWPETALQYVRDYTEGWYDVSADYQVIRPSSQASIDLRRDCLVIGDAGDGVVEFCVRKHLDGVWAYYAIDEVWRFKAPNLQNFVSGWSSGVITV